MLVSLAVDAHALEKDTKVSEAGYKVSSPHASRLLVDGNLLDWPDPEQRYLVSEARYPVSSPMGKTIRVDQSQDWATLHRILIEYDLASDDPPTAWDGWREYRRPVLVTDRKWMRVRITFTNAAAGRYQNEIRELVGKGVAVPLYEAGSVTMTGTSPKTLTYAQGTYPAVPAVFAQPTAENSAWLVLQTNKSATSVDLQVVDQNGEPVSGASISYVVMLA